MNIKQDILIRIYLVFALICIAGAAVLVKAYQIQTYKGDYWVEMSDSLTTKMFEITAERGNIYSEDESLLATSLPFFDLFVDFGSKAMSDELFENNVDSLAICMANTFEDKSASAYKKAFVIARKYKKHYFPLRKDVDYAQLKMMQQWPLFRAGKYKGGLIVETRQKRKNPYGILAQRTIGYSRAKADVGLEAKYNSYLEGSKGKILKQKIAGGTWVPIEKENAIEPQNGKDIITTLDINLQDVAETALANAITVSEAKYGCVIVMEVKTGAIKAIANLGWDAAGNLTENVNYAISHRTEPGSTFKLVSYLAMLDDGLISLNDSVNITNGVAAFSGAVMRDDHPSKNILTPTEAFAQSSNVAVARFMLRAYGKNKARFYEKMKQFGITSKSGIDLKGEVTPGISSPDKWSKLSLPWKATGYENLLTPMQLLTFYNSVANGGTRMQPYLVSRIVDNGKIVKDFKPVVQIKSIASAAAIKDAHELLKAVINDEHGTGKSIRSSFFQFAGKTGTAKILDETGYGNSNQAMFCGFFPADAPKYSCLVMIYKPQGIYRTGGGIAAPVFKTIAEKILSTDKNIGNTINAGKKPSAPSNVAINGEVHQIKTIAERWQKEFKLSDSINYVDVKLNRSAISIKPVLVRENLVPDVTGMAFDDALFLLENAGLKIVFSGKGKVVSQSLPSGTQVKNGEIITIQLR
jgi:cell division protein FtsI (penicillin-binding protein 3)